jgi:hypothetical protein
MPVKGKIRIPLSIDNVFKRVSEHEIYVYYLGQDFLLGKPIHSPFRKDTNPSFTIILGKNGRLHHMDYADTEHSGDCINFVCQLFKINSTQALMKIDHDFNLQLSTSHDPSEIFDIKRVEIKTKELQEQTKKFIQVKSRKFDSAELAYWNSYHITEKMLKDNNVYAVKDLYLDRKKYPLRNDLCFAYLFESKDKEVTWKIYWPERKKLEKWLGNTPNTQMSGMHRINKGDDYPVITKSKKDEMVLSLFLPHVASVQSESIFAINDENLSLLQSCTNVYINFDNDETGVKACRYYNQFGFRWINCPLDYKDPKGKIIKDFADLGKHFGIETVMAYFKKKHIPIIY